MTDAVVCEDLWKSYHFRRPVGLKTLLVGASMSRETRFARTWALSGVSFRVARGHAFGVVGYNGSGKSTLLSLLLGTVHSDRGKLEMRGRVAPLLEVGAGFHGDLTGRENVFLYGSILGMTIKEIRDCYERIAEFSELEDALENPVRTYSAGMIARLGFSINIHSPAEILLIDEVLAVGDARFQEKCRRFLRAFKARDGTLIVVSHNMVELASICDEGICLDMGHVIHAGSIQSVIEAYRRLVAAVEAGNHAQRAA